MTGWMRPDSGCEGERMMWGKLGGVGRVQGTNSQMDRNE